MSVPRHVSFGTLRDDGDLDLIATLNDENATYSDEEFRKLTKAVFFHLQLGTTAQVHMMYRQDAPPTINPDE